MSSGFNPKRRPDGAALIIALLLAAFGGVLLWDASRLAEIGAGYSGVGPASAPRLIGIILVILAFCTVVDAYKGRFPSRPRQAPQPLLWIIGGLLFQLISLKTLGFSIASGVMFACTAAAFGRRNLVFTIPIGIAAAFVIWLIFARVLMLSLPAGLLEHIFFPGVK